ncbi:hypothetical protein [Endozoicomonas atrinae]|uniref:hypothetical protein n=1 Tax=Endozoicomonas atrinae TaxID=1333660 RepID=UPI003B006E8B
MEASGPVPSYPAASWTSDHADELCSAISHPPQTRGIELDATQQVPVKKRKIDRQDASGTGPEIRITFPEVSTTGIDQTDHHECYLLAPGYTDGGGVLTAYAAGKLKQEHPELFEGYPDTPDYDDQWDQLMNSYGKGEGKHHFSRYNTVAKLVYDSQTGKCLSNVLTVPEHGWHATKTTMGVFRTSSFATIALQNPGEAIDIRGGEYAAKKDNERLKIENMMLKQQLDKSVSLLNSINQYIHTDQSHEEKIETLKAVLFTATKSSSDTPPSYSELVDKCDLIMGKEYRDAKASFEENLKKNIRKASGRLIKINRL